MGNPFVIHSTPLAHRGERSYGNHGRAMMGYYWAQLQVPIETKV